MHEIVRIGSIGDLKSWTPLLLLSEARHYEQLRRSRG
jgi:hypothetical protein